MSSPAQTERVPRWLLLTLATVVLWGVWGFESKILMAKTSAYNGQLLFTIGIILPSAFLIFSRRRFSGTDKPRGVFFAVLTGLLAGAGNVGFYMALKDGNASIVVPLTSLSPLATVLVGVLLMHEHMNRYQYLGLALALVSIYLLSL